MTAFASLRTRIYALAALLGLTALSLGVLLFLSSRQSRDAFRWVSHTQEVIISLDTLVGDLREGESGVRGYLLSGDRAYLRPLESDIGEATMLAARVRGLVADNPQQHARARRLQAIVASRTQIMRRAASAPRPAGAADPRSYSARMARGKQVMDGLTALAGAMRAEERALLAERSRRVEATARGAWLILFVGWPLLALIIAGAAWVILVSINRPLDDLLAAVNRFGAGDRGARAAVAGRSIEFRKLAAAYNATADALVEGMERQAAAEAEIARANAKLVDRSRALESRSRSIGVVSGMSQRLQAIQADREFAEVLTIYLPQVLPEMAGALYIHNSSRNLLVQAVRWGEPETAPETFAPESCWALRRGKEHVVTAPGADLLCGHARGGGAVERRCEPVLAGGEVLGLLYVEGAMDEEALFRFGLLVENVSLALVNETLRKRLREQSVRDPLTGLFNRRYMEEALALEAARAVRGGSCLAVIMADVDHFKRFNDTYGHEAGDALLRAVAALIQSHFRDGDIVCRYGGEEFLVIAPGATLALIQDRAEALRLAVRRTTVEFRGQRFGPVTMSFGIDCWEEGRAGRPEEMVGRADAALYRAKRLGRDRIEAAPMTTAAAIAAAE